MAVGRHVLVGEKPDDRFRGLPDLCDAAASSEDGSRRSRSRPRCSKSESQKRFVLRIAGRPRALTLRRFSATAAQDLLDHPCGRAAGPAAADQVERVRLSRRAPRIGGDPQDSGVDCDEDHGGHSYLQLFARSCRDRRTAGACTGRAQSRDRTSHRHRACLRPSWGPLRRRAAELHGQSNQDCSDDAPTNQRRKCHTAAVHATTDPAGQAG